MIKKVIGFNGSPRKGYNTDQLVQKCLEGAKSAGAEVKLYQISEMKNINPCISCLTCKRKEEKYHGKCAIQDGLTPILKEMKTADALVFGSPVYFGDISAAFHVAFERMCFSNNIYDENESSAFGKKIKTAFILTMNAKEEQAKFAHYDYFFERLSHYTGHIFGDCEIFPVYNTAQVKNYSKYIMTLFDVESKIREHREVFPEKLKEAYELGKRLVS